MKMLAYQYEFFPRKDQVPMLNQHFGGARFAYNKGLAMQQEHYKTTGKGLRPRDVQDRLVALKSTEEFSWLYDINSQTLLAALGNLKVAFKNFFEKRADFPKYKSKKAGWQSFQCPQHVKVSFERQTITLPKIGEIKASLHRETPAGAKIKTCTINRSPTGRYTISVLCEIDEIIPKKATVEPDLTIGVDVGISSLYTDSIGQHDANPRFLGKALERLAIEQKILARKKQDSHGRKKQRLRVTKTHERVANARHDWQHKKTAALCYKSHVTSIAVENLGVKNMIRNRKLARHIADAAWGSFLQKLNYKAEWAGKNVLEVDRWFPSSKSCSRCGWKNSALTLKDRTFHCQQCNAVLDRDVNASINILNEALRIHAAGLAVSVKSSPGAIASNNAAPAKGASQLAECGSLEAHARAPKALGGE